MLEEGLETVAIGSGAHAGTIFMGSDPETLRAVAVFGAAARRLLEAGRPPNQDLMRRTWNRAKPLLVSRPDPDPQFIQCAARSQHVISVRLHDGSRAFGLLQLAKTRGSFTARDAKVVAALSRYITTSVIQTTSLRKQELVAAHDPLTGLRNVRELGIELTRAVSAARRSTRNMALMFVDVDHLKKVNSKLGHSAGSEALKRTGRALDEASVGVASVFRFGGDEFVVVQRQASKESARALADHLRSHVAESTAGPMRPEGILPRITVSVGVATLNGLRELNGQPPSALRARLMTTADRALFRAKSAGRNRVVVATGRDDKLDNRQHGPSPFVGG